MSISSIEDEAPAVPSDQGANFVLGEGFGNEVETGLQAEITELIAEQYPGFRAALDGKLIPNPALNNYKSTNVEIAGSKKVVLKLESDAIEMITTNFAELAAIVGLEVARDAVKTHPEVRSSNGSYVVGFMEDGSFKIWKFIPGHRMPSDVYQINPEDADDAFDSFRVTVSAVEHRPYQDDEVDPHEVIKRSARNVGKTGLEGLVRNPMHLTYNPFARADQ